jgi:hypothetical protein
MKIFFIFAFVLFLEGCSTTNPFKQEKLQAVAYINPVLIKEDFASKIPEKLQIVSSVSFKSYWHSFYSLGYFKRDLTKNCFTLVALDPTGIRLFQIMDDDGNLEYSASINEFKNLNSFVSYIAEDIKNVYFNDIPSDNATITKKESKIIFTEPRRDDKIEYTFGGGNNNLLKKVLLRKRSWFWRIFMDDYYSVWSVGYYGYKNKNGKLYPINIYYENNALNYQLIFGLKEIM